MNLSARAGRWSARHWRRATLGWLLFAGAAILLGSAVGTRSLTQAEANSGETATAEHILAAAGLQEPAAESVPVQNRSLTVADRSFSAVVTKVVRTVSRSG